MVLPMGCRRDDIRHTLPPPAMAGRGRLNPTCQIPCPELLAAFPLPPPMLGARARAPFRPVRAPRSSCPPPYPCLGRVRVLPALRFAPRSPRARVASPCGLRHAAGAPVGLRLSGRDTPQRVPRFPPRVRLPPLGPVCLWFGHRSRRRAGRLAPPAVPRAGKVCPACGVPVLAPEACAVLPLFIYQSRGTPPSPR